MPTAEDRILVFQDTLARINASPKLTDAVRESVRNSRIFYEEDEVSFDRPALLETVIRVTGERSYECAVRLTRENPGKRVAVLNFANAFHPGGGVTSGAGAQEECLCRCSTLYPVLTDPALKGYYDRHKSHRNDLASDSLIYSRDIIVMKSDEALPQPIPEEEYTDVDVITCAAPDLRWEDLFKEGQYWIHEKRIRRILTCAAACGADILVLGAFGCGAFRNDPETVAHAFRDVLNSFPKVFTEIEFAVMRPAKGSRNYDVFMSVLGQNEAARQM